MQNSPLMRVMNRPRDLCDHGGGNAAFHRALPNPHGQTSAIHELHREEGVSVMLSDLVNRHDIRVIEAGHGFRFRSKTLSPSFTRKPSAQNHLQGDHAIGSTI